MSQNTRKGKGHGYIDEKNNKECMIRCYKCGRENWAMAVASGTCAWCGYDPNKKLKKAAAKVDRARKSAVDLLILQDTLRLQARRKKAS